MQLCPDIYGFIVFNQMLQMSSFQICEQVALNWAYGSVLLILYDVGKRWCLLFIFHCQTEGFCVNHTVHEQNWTAGLLVRFSIHMLYLMKMKFETVGPTHLGLCALSLFPTMDRGYTACSSFKATDKLLQDTEEVQ